MEDTPSDYGRDVIDRNQCVSSAHIVNSAEIFCSRLASKTKLVGKRNSFVSECRQRVLNSVFFKQPFFWFAKLQLLHQVNGYLDKVRIGDTTGKFPLAKHWQAAQFVLL